MSSQDSVLRDEEKIIGIGAKQTGQCKLNNCISLPEIPLSLEEDEIFEAATDYQNWSYGRYTLSGLPAMDNSATFGLTVDIENTNLREEIKKLVGFVGSKEPPVFDSYGTLGGTNAAGFKDLYNVVDQIRTNLHIIRHENATLALDHYQHEDFYEIFSSSRRQLRVRFVEKPRGITGHRPIILDDEDRNMQAYHALIDFVFHSLAWWLTHILESKAWHAPIIAILSRWSVKLKLIALDSSRWAGQALVNGEDAMRRISHFQKDEDRIKVQLPPQNPEREGKLIFFPEDKDLDYYYYTNKLQVRESMHDLVRRVLNNLVATRSNTRTPTAFEVRTLIYKGSLDETLRQLTVQRDGMVETSSDPTELMYSYRALQLLLSNSQRISQSKADATHSEIAKIHWYIRLVKSSDPEIRSLTTARLDDVVSALVPLSLMGSSKMVKKMSNPLPPGHVDDESFIPKFELLATESPRIEFSLSTRQARSHTPYRPGLNMVPTSKSPIIASIEDLARGLEECDSSSADSFETRLKKSALKTYKQYKSRQAEIQDWDVTEDSVLVRTKKYSGVVLTVAMAIIGGSLSVPFLVGERIPGVDPFQFVTFGWLLAGAFLVGAKSRYVESWPWHDFLRGQIVCKTVSELAVASRVKKQAVLLYLLHKEFQNPLLFRGPYHGVFRRRAGSGWTDGFSIDVPVAHATVLAAGFIVLEVRGLRERERQVHTVLHDTREDVPENPDGESIVFDRLQEVADDQDEKATFRHRKTIRQKTMEGSSITLGQYEVVGLPTADCDFI